MFYKDFYRPTQSLFKMAAEKEERRTNFSLGAQKKKLRTFPLYYYVVFVIRPVKNTVKKRISYYQTQSMQNKLWHVIICVQVTRVTHVVDRTSYADAIRMPV
jgi:hypothetical protein